MNLRPVLALVAFTLAAGTTAQAEVPPAPTTSPPPPEVCADLRCLAAAAIGCKPTVLHFERAMVMGGAKLFNDVEYRLEGTDDDGRCVLRRLWTPTKADVVGEPLQSFLQASGRRADDLRVGLVASLRRAEVCAMEKKALVEVLSTQATLPTTSTSLRENDAWEQGWACRPDMTRTACTTTTPAVGPGCTLSACREGVRPLTCGPHQCVVRGDVGDDPALAATTKGSALTCENGAVYAVR